MIDRTDVMADMAVEAGRLRATLAAREAEVAWLRAWKLWARRELNRAEIRGELPDDPEPQPPDGVRPMHTINIDCWCHVCAQAKAEYRLRADRAEERLAELACDLALMTHSRDSFRAVVIAGEPFRARAAELEAALRALVEAAINERCSMCRSGDAAYSDIVGAHVDQFANHPCKTPLLRVSLTAALLLLAKGGK